MKKNDPRLTAFVLGELNVEDAIAVKDAMLLDPAIAAEIAAIQEMVNTVAESYGTSEKKLNATQRSKIFSAGNHSKIEDIESGRGLSSSFTWISAGVGIAAAVTLLITFSGKNDLGKGEVSFRDFSSEELKQRLGASSVAFSPSTDSQQALASENNVAAAIQKSPMKFRASASEKAAQSPPTGISENLQNTQNWQIVSEQNSTFLPLTCSTLSWDWIKELSNSNNALSPSMIRSEELINAAKLPFVENFSLKGVGAGLEFAPCPWEEDNLLVIVHFNNKGTKTINNVSTGITFSSNVEQFRLLGYGAESSILKAPISASIDADYRHSVVYEITLTQNPLSIDSLATLHLKAEEEHRSLKFNFNKRESENLSPASQFAVAVNYWTEVSLSKNPTPNQLQSAKESLEKVMTSSQDEKVSILCKVLSSFL